LECLQDPEISTLKSVTENTPNYLKQIWALNDSLPITDKKHDLAK